MDRSVPPMIKAIVSKPIRNCFYFCCDMVLLGIIMTLQGACLNLYVMNEYPDETLPHFLFLGDFICVVLAMVGMRATYIYLQKSKEEESNGTPPDQSAFIYSPKKFLKKFPTSKLGVLPLSYMSWLVYILFLLVKIIIIYWSGLSLNLKTTDLLGPQTLKMTIAFTSITFMLFVEAHNWDFVSAERRAYVTTVCVKTGFEIFDSVDMLSLITDQQQEERKERASHLPDSVLIPYENLIFTLVALNFILPFLSLYKLSLPDKQNQSNLSLMIPVHVLYHLLHLFFVDLPFLSVRVYAWIMFHTEISMFLMKNLLHIIISIRSIYPELRKMATQDKSSPPVNEQPARGNEFEDIALN
ncbi:uncharacterized protein [Bemisia tabaci]|uniref:uncharacterized protein isoform X2 n=1 Tax=Bemisia tabaci TaxID=7038 RepID=UPI003B28B3F0